MARPAMTLAASRGPNHQREGTANMARKPITELTGGVIRGMLTVIGEAPERVSAAGNKCRMAICRCECGNIGEYQAGNLKRDENHHCGCGPRKPSPRVSIEKLCGGKVFGSLTLINEVPGRAIDGHGVMRMAVCLCVCGSQKQYFPQNLKRGLSTGCGCDKGAKIAAAKTTHGEAGHGPENINRTPEYRTWSHMIGRCHNETDASYYRYGGRGIYVCDRWRYSYENFRDDMGKRPKGKSIDRWPDNDGPYAPWNCRWATQLEQCRNKRTNRMVTFRGETLCSKDMAAKYGLSRTAFENRLDKLNWSLEDALTTPLYQRRAT